MKRKAQQRTTRDPTASAAGDAAAPERRRALEALAEVSQMVAGDLDLDSVLRSAMTAATEAIDAQACSILLQDAAANRLTFHLVEGPQARPLAKASVPIDDNSIAGWVAHHQEALLIPDAYEDPRFNRDYDRRTGFRTRSIISAPLVAKGRPVGVIQVLNRRDGRSFDERDLELARAVASLVAVAIHNAEEHEARLQAERLATIGQTVAGMAHCVKNILNGLRAGSYILDQNLSEETPDGVRRGWKMVKRNMQILSDIVLDMLAYTKKRQPLYQDCDVGELCEDVVKLLEEQARARDVRLEARSDIETVCVDGAGVRRCLINLAGNAIDACAEKGDACVELLVGPADDQPGHFAIHVRDNGCGMEPDVRDKIFDPFFSTKGGKGTGLGLAVTRKIVEEHGGALRVESTIGAGTEFILVLPVRPPNQEESSSP